MKPILKRGVIQKGFTPKVDDVVKESRKELALTGKTLLDTVEESLEEDGITLFDNSDITEDYLRLPADITEEQSRELGKYFNAFTKQKMWVRTLLGRTKALLREKKDLLDDIKDRVYQSLPAKMSVTEKELRLRSDERDGKKASALLKDLAFLEEKVHMLEDYLDNLVDAIVCISREITRRESDWGDEKRGNTLDKGRR